MEGGSEGEKKKTPEGEPKTKRKMKTASQREILEKPHAVETYPGESLPADLSAKLGLSDRQLQMWFRHRRLKEVKPPSAKRAPNDSPTPSTTVAGSTPLRVGPAGDEMAVGEVGIEDGSGSGSGSSPFRHMDSWRIAGPRAGSAVARSFVEAQLGEPLREDGPMVGMEFDPLPPDAFGALTVPVGQKQAGRPYKAKLHKGSDSKSNKGIAKEGLHEYQFLLEQPTVRVDTYVDCNENDESETDDGSMGCDQRNDFSSDDELGHEALVDVIDESGRPKKRGITRLNNIWKLPKGVRVTVEVNKNFQVVGENSSLFPRFLGTMARKGNYCPLNYLTWPKVPKEYKNRCLTTIESKFILKFNDDDEMVRKRWTRFSLSCLGRKWRDFRNELKEKFFDVSKTKEQMIGGIPSYVDPTQMKCLIDYWLSPEGKARSEKNKFSRSFQKDVHTLGGKTYARLAHELEIKDGRAQTRSDLYIKSRKRKDGEPVTEIAAKNIKEMETLISQQEIDPSRGICGEIIYAEDDVYSQVISKKERNGRIRGLGFGPIASRTSSSSKSKYYDLIEQHINDVNIIKALQEEILQNEAERVEKEKQFEQRLKMLEQLLPRACIDGSLGDESSLDLQQKSSCASHHEGDN